MQKSDNQTSPSNARRRVQTSTTLNRKYVRRPAMISDASVKVQRKEAKRAMASGEIKIGAKTENACPKKVSAKELKDQAIKKALASAASPENKANTQKKEAKFKKKEKVHFGFGRILLALGCAAAAVFAIVYFVNMSMPDVSLKVAAMQTGIEASYPNYVPRGFSLTDITSEEGKVTLNFKNAEENIAFTLTEEQSSWDSNALLNNYVKDEYGENYTTVKEQGLTIYISNSDATWVNGGVVYTIDTTSGSLTKKQITTIATSL